MNPFLSRLIAQAQGQAPTLEPRLPGRFETPARFEGSWAGEAVESLEQAAPRAPGPAPAEPAPLEPARPEIPPPARPSPRLADPQAPEPSGRRKRSRAEKRELEARPSPIPHPEPLPAPLEPPPAHDPLPEPPREPGVRPARVGAGVEGAENPLLPPVAPPLTQRPELSEAEPGGLEPPRPRPALEAPALLGRQVSEEHGSSLFPAPRQHVSLPEARPAAPEAPVIRIHIGRVEVRALFGPPPEGPKAKAAPQGLSLEDFLKGRGR